MRFICSSIGLGKSNPEIKFEPIGYGTTFRKITTSMGKEADNKNTVLKNGHRFGKWKHVLGGWKTQISKAVPKRQGSAVEPCSVSLGLGRVVRRCSVSHHVELGRTATLWHRGPQHLAGRFSLLELAHHRKAFAEVLGPLSLLFRPMLIIQFAERLLCSKRPTSRALNTPSDAPTLFCMVASRSDKNDVFTWSRSSCVPPSRPLLTFGLFQKRKQQW